jgi:diphthamide synthase (EF-2-diphthine--ammonia ligase)
MRRIWGCGGKSGLYNALGAVHSWDSKELLDEAEQEVGIVEVRWIWGMDLKSSLFGPRGL